MMAGAERIAAERQRQIEVEGWTAEHDAEHGPGMLSAAALCYLDFAVGQSHGYDLDSPPYHWPWDNRWWKPSDDPVRNLEKAGALIAAEIDRSFIDPPGEEELIDSDPVVSVKFDPMGGLNPPTEEE